MIPAAWSVLKYRGGEKKETKENEGVSGRTTSSPSPDLLVLWQRSLTTLFVGKGPQSTWITVLSWKGPFENAALPHFYLEGWAQWGWDALQGQRLSEGCRCLESPRNRCGKRWAKLFAGCSLKGLRVFHDLMAKYLVSVLWAKPTQVWSRRWARCSQLGSSGGDVMVGEPHNSHWVLLLLPLADARNKNSRQNHSAPLELFHLAKKPGLSFHHWTYFFFSHKDTLCQISQKFGICTNRSDCILFLYITWKTSIFL